MITDYFFDVRLMENTIKLPKKNSEVNFIFTLCRIKKNSRNMTKI